MTLKLKCNITMHGVKWGDSGNCDDYEEAHRLVAEDVDLADVTQIIEQEIDGENYERTHVELSVWPMPARCSTKYLWITIGYEVFDARAEFDYCDFSIHITTPGTLTPLRMQVIQEQL